MVKIILYSLFSVLCLANISVSAQFDSKRSIESRVKSSLQKLQQNHPFNPLATTGDTIHVSKYFISIDSIDFPGHAIRAHVQANVHSRMMNVTTVSLALLRMTIDSITDGTIPVNYTYNDTIINILPWGGMNTGDSVSIYIYYHGLPQEDASGWGGFYFSGNYAFNLGVGFAAIPHNFGRAWFPCIDEFTDKSKYEFYINTSSTNKAFCNGFLQGQVTNPNGTITWHWVMDDSIPSYLACMNVAPFYTLNRTVNGIPVTWAEMPADTNNTLATFTHLSNALTAYSSGYGPYRWNKVGYTLVPFSSGAMEHATAISVGSAYINGTMTYETLWAHELSHHWWGDLVTCKNAGCMWLNEGFAVYSEAYFTEAVYGSTAYKNWIRSNHRKVLQFSHIVDGSYLSLDSVPLAYTYGNTVYQKGGDVAHTLRKYMGDSAFFTGARGYMNDLAFQNADNTDFKNELTANTGIDMTTFFNDWVLTPGNPHFSIDSFTVAPGGPPYQITVYIRQRQKGNTHIYTMPVECFFTDGVTQVVDTFLINAPLNSYTVTLPFNPVWVALDRNEKISDAEVDYEKNLDTLGAWTFLETNSVVNVTNSGGGTSTVRIEHNFVPPDGFSASNPGIRLSDYHYYRVDGSFTPTFSAHMTLYYDGSTSGGSGYLDNTLITGIEDSLVLMYRPNTATNWSRVNGYALNTSSNHNDKKGNFNIDTLKKGEYCFGYYDYTVGNSHVPPKPKYSLQVNPNPANQMATINFHLGYGENGIISIFDTAGKIVYHTQVFSHQEFINFDTQLLKSGVYFVTLNVNEKEMKTTKLIISKK